MAITPKPKPKNTLPADSDVDVDALIHRGGSVAGHTSSGRPAKNDEEEVMLVQLRLVPALVGKIDAVVKARPIKTPRHTWLLEAVMEKLAREAKTS